MRALGPGHPGPKFGEGHLRRKPPSDPSCPPDHGGMQGSMGVRGMASGARLPGFYSLAGGLGQGVDFASSPFPPL